MIYELFDAPTEECSRSAKMMFRKEQCDFGVSGRVLSSHESDRDEFGFYEISNEYFFGGNSVYIYTFHKITYNCAIEAKKSLKVSADKVTIKFYINIRYEFDRLN